MGAWKGIQKNHSENGIALESENSGSGLPIKLKCYLYLQFEHQPERFGYKCPEPNR